MNRALLLAAALCVVVVADDASATITQEFNAAGVDANYTVDWSLYGAPGAGLSTPVFETVGPESVGVASSSGALQIRQEGTDWSGIFAVGDNLLFQPNQSDTTIVNFSTPVQGVGTQIQSDAFGNFTAYMDLFDSLNNLLGEVSVTGDNTGAEDNTAPFIGALSSSADISYAMFWVNVGNPLFAKQGDLAINALVFDAPASVPEPASLALLGLGLVGLGLARRRKAA